jgi:hypothetical protein
MAAVENAEITTLAALIRAQRALVGAQMQVQRLYEVEDYWASHTRPYLSTSRPRKYSDKYQGNLRTVKVAVAGFKDTLDEFLALLPPALTRNVDTTISKKLEAGEMIKRARELMKAAEAAIVKMASVVASA